MAQPHFVDGYYITLEGDTVLGKLNESNPWVLRVKGKGKIPEDQFLSYYFSDNNRKFIRTTVKNTTGGLAKTKNLEILYEGDVSIYNRGSKFYLHPRGEDTFFLSKRESIIFENGKHYLNDIKGYAGTMIHFMEPCILPSDFKDQKILSKTLVERIFEKYYSCSKTEFTAYGNVLPKVRFSLAPFAALTSGDRSIEIEKRNFGQVNYTREDGLSFGAMGVVEFPRWTSFVALEFGFQTLNTEYTSTVYTEDLWLEYENNLIEKVNESFLNFGIRLKMPYKVSPYIFVGPELAFMKSDGLDYSGRRYSDTNESEITPGTIEMDYNTSVGLNAGAGLSINFGLFNPYFEYRLRRHSDYASDIDLETKNATFKQQNLIFGIRFEF